MERAAFFYYYFFFCVFFTFVSSEGGAVSFWMRLQVFAMGFCNIFFPSHPVQETQPDTVLSTFFFSFFRVNSNLRTDWKVD